MKLWEPNSKADFLLGHSAGCLSGSCALGPVYSSVSLAWGAAILASSLFGPSSLFGLLPSMTWDLAVRMPRGLRVCRSLPSLIVPNSPSDSQVDQWKIDFLLKKMKSWRGVDVFGSNVVFGNSSISEMFLFLNIYTSVHFEMKCFQAFGWCKNEKS